MDQQSLPRIHFESNGKETRKFVSGIDNVNKELAFMGAKLFLIEPNTPIPSRSFLGKQINSRKSPLFPNKEFKESILNCFAMSQSEILQQIRNDCHREPHYYDYSSDDKANEIIPMVAAGPPLIRKINHYVNGLHINATAPDGTGFDEIMTIIKQTNEVHMFFVGLDGICRHLILPPINKKNNNDVFWRFKFNSTSTPHYVLLDEEGIYLHYSIGGNEHKKRCWFSKERLLKETEFKETTSTQLLSRLGQRPFGIKYTIKDSKWLPTYETIDLMLFIIRSRCKQTIHKQSNKGTNYVY